MDYSSALIRKSSTGQLVTGCDFPFPIIGISLFMENGSVLTVAYNSGLRGLADSIFLWAHNCKETDLNESHHDDALTVSSSSSSPTATNNSLEKISTPFGSLTPPLLVPWFFF